MTPEERLKQPPKAALSDLEAAFKAGYGCGKADTISQVRRAIEAHTGLTDGEKRIVLSVLQGNEGKG